jgi:pimeloyl-ACP methyl ester carboxylesterase
LRDRIRPNREFSEFTLIELRETMSTPTWQIAAIEQLKAGSRVSNTARGPVEYAEIGNPHGPAVLSIHGRPGGYDQSLVMARTLGEDLARWIAVSRPGYLRTPIETGRTPPEQADAYAALLDVLGIGPAVAVGLSAGGPSALQFALRHANRCRGLVLVSALSRRKLRRERTSSQKFYDAMIAPSDRLAWILYRVCCTRWTTPQAREALGSVLLLSQSLRGAGRDNDLAQNEALPPEPPFGILVPTLIIHGTADRVVPMAHPEAALEAIHGAKLVRVTGGGHGIFVTRTAELKPIFAEFLESLPHSR